MTPTDKNTMDSLGQDPRAQRIGELLNSFCDRRARGEDLTEERFLSEYPDYAEDLRQHLSSLNMIQELGSSDSSQPTLPGDATPVTQGSSNIDKFKDSSPPLPDIPGYDVRKQIGRGGMGLVFKAVQRSTKRVVADPAQPARSGLECRS